MSTVSMDRIAELVVQAGYAAYVEQTGGGCATVYASREWEDRLISRTVGGATTIGTARFPKARDEDGHCEVAAGPGWFDRDGDAFRALGDPDDFSIGPDDDGGSDASPCTGMDEAAVAALIVEWLNRPTKPCPTCGTAMEDRGQTDDVEQVWSCPKCRREVYERLTGAAAIERIVDVVQNWNMGTIASQPAMQRVLDTLRQHSGEAEVEMPPAPEPAVLASAAEVLQRLEEDEDLNAPGEEV